MTHQLTRRSALALSLAALAAPRIGLAQQAPPVTEMAKGASSAPVTVIEYASFTCPHCATFHREVLPELEANFIDPGQVRLVYREVYFDRPGLWASMIARCAGPDRFFGVVDLLYQRQAEWSRAGDDAAIIQALYSIGRQAGLTDAQMDACTQDRDFAEALVARFQETTAADGVNSTPSFVIDGETLGNMSYADFAARLNSELGL